MSAQPRRAGSSHPPPPIPRHTIDTQETSQNAALLLDFENLIIPFARRQQQVALEPIVDFVEDTFGNVIFRRAYADWGERKFAKYQQALQALGVEMIQVPRPRGPATKNSADILLSADAVECLLLRPFIQVFAIVSGDSDIGPLITKLRSHGKMVVVVGPDEKSTARHVINLADRFKFYADIVTPEAEDTPGARPETPQAAVLALLQEAGGPIESADLKRRLMAMPGFGDFREKAQGFRSWTGFLNSIDGVEVDRRADLGIDVRLRDKG